MFKPGGIEPVRVRDSYSPARKELIVLESTDPFGSLKQHSDINQIEPQPLQLKKQHEPPRTIKLTEANILIPNKITSEN